MNTETQTVASHDDAERDMELLIGKLLRGGVLLSAFVVTLGAILFLLRHASEQPALHEFHGVPENLRTIRGLISGASRLNGAAVIGVGLWLLVLTPVARVTLTLVSFIRQRDRAFILITGFVLTALVWALAHG